MTPPSSSCACDPASSAIPHPPTFEMRGLTVSNLLAVDFTGRVVIVTGASSGIGRSVAMSFADAGASVLGTGRNQQALAELSDAHPSIQTIRCDVSEQDASQSIVRAAVDRW